MAHAPNSPHATEQPAAVVEEQLHCALTGRPVTRAEAYWAPPLVTARELVTMIVRVLLRSPGLIGQVLMAEQPNVPYAPEARQLLAQRRSSEQIKLLVGLLVLMALITAPIFWMALR